VAPEDFIVEEAALLDAGRFDDWLALFDSAGRYWVPLLGSQQADPLRHNSLAYEDRLLLQLRVDRLKDPRAHSQHPRSSCQHVLQRPVVEVDGIGNDANAGEGAGNVAVVLRTPFIYVESRGEEQLLLAGCYRHELVRRLQSWVIRLKRVDLLNPSRALPAVQLFI
jgi:3-phenylpropionate/cinnamic acid dioxygenase small subunit